MAETPPALNAVHQRHHAADAGADQELSNSAGDAPRTKPNQNVKHVTTPRMRACDNNSYKGFETAQHISCHKEAPCLGS